MRLGQGQARAGHGQVVARYRGDLLDRRRSAVLGVDDDLDGDFTAASSLMDWGVMSRACRSIVEGGAVELS